MSDARDMNLEEYEAYNSVLMKLWDEAFGSIFAPLSGRIISENVLSRDETVNRVVYNSWKHPISDRILEYLGIKIDEAAGRTITKKKRCVDSTAAMKECVKNH